MSAWPTSCSRAQIQELRFVSEAASSAPRGQPLPRSGRASHAEPQVAAAARARPRALRGRAARRQHVGINVNGTITNRGGRPQLAMQRSTAYHLERGDPPRARSSGRPELRQEVLAREFVHAVRTRAGGRPAGGGPIALALGGDDDCSPPPAHEAYPRRRRSRCASPRRAGRRAEAPLMAAPCGSRCGWPKPRRARSRSRASSHRALCAWRPCRGTEQRRDRHDRYSDAV